MPTKRSRVRDEAAVNAPSLRVSPEAYLFPSKIQVIGTGWSGCPIELLIDGKEPVRPAIVLRGEASRDIVRPTGGEFVALLNIPGLRAGEHRIVAVEKRRGRRVEQTATFTLHRVPETGQDGRPTNRWFRRREHFLRERFPDGINRRPGSRLRALAHRDAMRELAADLPGPPVDPAANWYCIGPSVVRRGQVFSTTPTTYTVAPISGRITSIAYDTLDTNIVYAAAAQGGVWKSTDGGLNWRPKSDYTASLAIGCVTVDPSSPVGGKSVRILAGTGEPNNSDSYYGAGMLLSTDGGETWVVRGTATFARAAFSTIAVDPADNQHLYAATDIGVYESTDEGLNWTQVEPGVCFDLVVDWANVGAPELYVGRSGFGVRRSTDGGATWATLGGGLPASLGRVALAKAPGDANTVYAAFANSAGGLTGIYRTTDGGTTWTITGTTPAGTAQTGYNLALGVHPTNADTVIFGDVHLWRTTNAGGTWTRVSTGTPGIHADQHAVAFHPTNGNLVFIGNDGGAFYSTDGGVTYTQRNKDLATLQYFTIANHSLWDAVMLGGTQDNGAQRYLGHPAWEHSALGDGAYAAINATTDTRRWFESRWYGFPIFRSDSAGAPGTWVDKKGTIATNSSWFYPPFEMDPSDSRVLFVGYNRLWRTTDSGDSWTDITGIVAAGTNITAIAVAPSDGNTVYVGMQTGAVFRVIQSMGTWTATNVTSAPLPAGQISDIAIHPTNPNIAYVTTSNLIFSEGAGEFTNDHVFRTTDGGTTWVNRSTGLSQANPVNAIAIDPANPDTVWIGCDVGIFRTTDGGGMWLPWDNGLPNCSVQDLKFFAPRRLLRAATHGRSVWERPADAASLPLTDVYLRDDVLDTGIVAPGPSGVEHPFNVGETVYWYQSPDIKIDAPDPTTGAYQTPNRDIDYVEFEELVHDNPRRDTWVRVHVQIHNRGNNPATNVKVRAFWANAGGGLPNLPVDFWTAFPNTDPADTSVWHPVGPARTVAVIHPGQPKIASYSWLVPTTAPAHTCMLAAVRSDEDGVDTSSLVIATAVNDDNNVTLKNLHVDNVIPGTGGSDEGAGPYYIDFAVFDRKGLVDIRINPGTLPPGARVQMLMPEFKTRLPLEKSVDGVSIRSRKRIDLPERPEEACGEPTVYRTERAFVLEVGPRTRRRDIHAHAAHPGIVGIIPEDKALSAALFVRLPRGARRGGRYVFYVEHWSGGSLVGGSEYELRVSENPTKRR